MTGYHLIVERLPMGPWAARAACRGKNPAWWFPLPGRGVSYRTARPVCEGCPVRRPCLDHALAADETHGMWGGLDPDERARLARYRRRLRSDAL